MPHPPSLHLALSPEADLGSALSGLALQLQLLGQRPDFALVFCTLDYAADELAAGIQRLLPQTPWIGMGVHSLISGDQAFTQGIALGLFCGENLQPQLSHSLPGSFSDVQAGQHAARQVLEAGPRNTLLMLCNPVLGSISEGLRGALFEAGVGPRWIGGGSGSPQQPGFLMANGRVLKQPLVLAGLNLPSHTSLSQGWSPLWSTAQITRSKRSILYELDYRPALDTYTRMAEAEGLHFGNSPFQAFSLAHPLGVPLVSGQYLMHAVLSADSHGALHCATELPENGLVQLMAGHPSELIAATGQAASELRSRGKLAGALAFMGHARQSVLGLRAVEEREHCLRKLGAPPLLGCVCLGQIASLSGGVPQYHNQALALLGWSTP
ncbi:MAG: FIST signal transduction protein [Candidatus Sericytochromatia bacterium]